MSLVTDADGTSQREAWRRFVMGSCEPLLAIVGEECERKLDMRVSFDLRRLWAHDLAGRASAFKAMVVGGMAVERAAALSGLTVRARHHCDASTCCSRPRAPTPAIASTAAMRYEPCGVSGDTRDSAFLSTRSGSCLPQRRRTAP